MEIYSAPGLGYTLTDLQSSLESLDRDIQKSFDLTKIVVAMASHRVEHGLEAHDDNLLLSVADFAVQGTDLKSEDVLKASLEWSGLKKLAGAPQKGRDFLGSVITAGYQIVKDLITKFMEWITKISSKYRMAKAQYQTLKSEISDKMSDTDFDRHIRLTVAAQNLLQIDHKVITDSKELLSLNEDFAKFISGVIYTYAEALIQLSNDINSEVDKLNGNDSPESVVRNINGAILKFFNSTNKLTPKDVNESLSESPVQLGNTVFQRIGLTKDLLSKLNSNDVITNELGNVKFRYTDRNDTNVEIRGDLKVRVFTKAQCIDYVATALTTIDDIIKYNDVMEGNLKDQLRNLETGERELQRMEAQMDAKKIVVDGKRTINEISTVKEIYRYQTAIWRWGTTPITQALNRYFQISTALKGLTEASIAANVKLSKEA